VCFIRERFETTTEEQVAFFKNSINNSGAGIFIPFKAHCIRTLQVPCFLSLIIPVLSALILYYRQLLAKVLYQLFSCKKEIIHEILIETIRANNSIKGMLIIYIS
jgi:hypothetical protein